MDKIQAVYFSPIVENSFIDIRYNGPNLGYSLPFSLHICFVAILKFRYSPM
jgi:hypothetical protein